MNPFSSRTLWMAAETGFSGWLSLPLSLSFNFQGPFKAFSSSLYPFYCHGSKSPECNRNKALSGLIRLFLSYPPPFPSRFYHVRMFGFCLFGSWMSPLKVIWSLCLLRLCTRSSHMLLLSPVINPPQPNWNLLTATTTTTTLTQIPSWERKERKPSKVSWGDFKRKREINTKQRTFSTLMCAERTLAK